MTAEMEVMKLRLNAKGNIANAPNLNSAVTTANVFLQGNFFSPIFLVRIENIKARMFSQLKMALRS